MVRWAAALALVLLVPSIVRAQDRPTFSVQDGVVASVLPLRVLQDPNVRRQLDSGLTTTFLVTARTLNRSTTSRLEVRYDLWDEIWIVRRVEFDGRVVRDRLATAGALEKWWRAPVRILATGEPRIPLRLEVNVLPFSAAEEDDAREWISKSGGVGTSGAGGGIIVDALIGTTLSARPITTFRWTVELTLR